LGHAAREQTTPSTIILLAMVLVAAIYDDDEGERKPKRYLRKKQVARRYGGVHERTIPRMVADGRLPPPDRYNGRFPLWSEDMLDAHDRQATRALARREAAR
jgi:hypothetical protein